MRLSGEEGQEHTIPCPVCGRPAVRVYVNPRRGDVYAYHRLDGDSRLCYVGTLNLRKYVRYLTNIMGLRGYVPTLFANVRYVDQDGVPSALNADPVYLFRKELERLCGASLELCRSAVSAVREFAERAEEVLREAEAAEREAPEAEVSEVERERAEQLEVGEPVKGEAEERARRLALLRGPSRGSDLNGLLREPI